MIITKTCNSCEHFPNDKHCIGCEWDKSKGENSKWELKENPVVIERAVLDKIRAEIESMDFDFGDYYDHTNKIIEMVCKTIDKYRTESEERNEVN